VCQLPTSGEPEGTANDDEACLHDVAPLVGRLPLGEEPAIVKLKARRLLSDVNVDSSSTMSEGIRAVPTPFTPACDGHALAPITGPIVVRGAKPGDVVSIE
jgi:hypothetical protein